MPAYRSLLAALCVAGLAAGRRLPAIHWNSSNSIFEISNTDHVMQVEIGDQVSIVCPEPGPLYEFSELYMVSEDDYQHCTISEEHSKLIGACKNAKERSTLSIVFRKYSPIPGGLEFVPGRTYFIISTADGTEEGINLKEGGLCLKKQMKIKFEVEPDRHHHKLTRHDERNANPKFAARTVDRSSSSSSSTAVHELAKEAVNKMEYIIHENDVDAASHHSLLPTVLWLSIGYLIRGR